ncbi:C40 family peptidase [Leifsonia flava]|uniref:NlpC/P60 family protein n=1 Tax=Orlajensenia leifsoniae TaxID=2561933 RepID=A0A4Y9R5L6_9MICO|nr:C40 family peptidase [Leifsonia flava]TFV98826.1 NlpC/P60 family protein [Leifsonia flava]
MSIVDAAARVETIRGMIDGLVTNPAATTTTRADAATATGFASELSSVQGSAIEARSSAPSTGSATGADVVTAAKGYLGVPYVFGGEDSSGMDCSGLVQRVYADLGIDLPRRVTQQMTEGTEVGSLAEAQPGDLIVTGGGDHILIYAGDGKVIHAPYEGRTVSLVDAYMSDDEITTIRRIVPTASAAPAAVPTAAAVTSAAGVAADTNAAMTDLITAAYRSLLAGAAA